MCCSQPAMHTSAIVHLRNWRRCGLGRKRTAGEALLADTAPPELRAARFHLALVRVVVELSEGHETVLLSGGCFQNALLRQLAFTGAILLIQIPRGVAIALSIPMP